MTPQQLKAIYQELITDVINDSSKLSAQTTEFKFESQTKVILKVNKRLEFRTDFEASLKKEKVNFESKAVAGSSFQATIVDFKKYFPQLKPLTILYKESKGAGKVPTAKTAWQERGAAYIFERSLVENVDFDKKLNDAMTKLKVNKVVLTKKVLPEDVLLETFKDELPKLKEIFEIRNGGDFPYIDWLNSFYFSQKVLLKKYSNSTFQRFERDGGFMDYITKLINVKFNISKKDTWNPADVWAIKGTQQQIEKFIADGLKNVDDYKVAATKFKDDKLDNYIRAGVLKLNSLLIDLLTGTNPKVVGISLKLTDSGAYIEEVNFDKVKEKVEENKFLIDTMADSFKVDPKEDFVCNFAISKLATSKGTFTQDVRVLAEDLNSGDGYNFQIKANSSESTKGSNLKFELTIKGKGAARGGKVPVELVEALVNKIQRGAFVNDYNKYPRTTKEFMDNLEKGKKYKTMFTKVKSKIKDIGVDYPDFVVNVADAFNRGGTFSTNATCKLMGFEFLYFLLSIDEKKMRSLITDMSFLAQKKNIRGYDTFGPFIKIS